MNNLSDQLRKAHISPVTMVRHVLKHADGSMSYNDIILGVHEVFGHVLARHHLFTMMSRMYAANEVSREKTGHDVQFTWKRNDE